VVMSRLPSQQAPVAIATRGNERKPIYRDDQDRERFLEMRRQLSAFSDQHEGKEAGRREAGPLIEVGGRITTLPPAHRSRRERALQPRLQGAACRQGVVPARAEPLDLDPPRPSA